MSAIGQRIREKAQELGFELVGIAPARKARHSSAYQAWLEEGHAGEMGWLESEPERRLDPRRVLDGALSVVALGVSYYTEDPPPDLWNDPSRGRIARYAWGADYHDVLTPMLQELAAFIRKEAGDEGSTRFYVDTGPVLERDVAARAGLGFIGKNSLIINPGYGSYVFLGEIITNIELDYDEPAVDDGATLPLSDGRTGTCGSCTRCVDLCPTHAFPAPYVLDSRLCISYLTIELKGEIPESLRPRMQNWIFGCDECQSVCPWVKRYSNPRDEPFLGFDANRCAPSLLELMTLDDAGFRERFRGTPVTRSKRRGLLRNAAVALGNWGDPEAKPALEAALKDPEPLVQSHAAWALERIG